MGACLRKEALQPTYQHAGRSPMRGSDEDISLAACAATRLGKLVLKLALDVQPWPPQPFALSWVVVVFFLRVPLLFAVVSAPPCAYRPATVGCRPCLPSRKSGKLPCCRVITVGKFSFLALPRQRTARGYATPAYNTVSRNPRSPRIWVHAPKHSVNETEREHHRAPISRNLS